MSKRFLITNDDGFDAPGITALSKLAEAFGTSMVVAPHHAHSGCSHQVTTDRPIGIHQHDHDVFSIEATPADCTRIGLNHLCKQCDWVLSGINAGGNLGIDVYHSGTVAAVREAVAYGVPGIAISHYRKDKTPFDWGRAVEWLAPLVAEILEQDWEPHSFWNINLPHLRADQPDPAVVVCDLDRSPHLFQYKAEGNELIYRGSYHDRPREPSCDIDVCFSGDIAMTLLHL